MKSLAMINSGLSLLSEFLSFKVDTSRTRDQPKIRRWFHYRSTIG